MNNLPLDNDLQTQLEAELAGSGRKSVVPKEGLVGPHSVRREASLEASEMDERLNEPLGGGSDVAPTQRAAQEERERHARQRELGVVAAGEDGNLRQRRAPTASREALDAAAHKAR
jgi:hypothetical protein